ncbi:MAG: ROK family protein [Hyphomicrobiales bacterium]|nr:ROK family protein [Hyphomicrobiales bacterium]
MRHLVPVGLSRPCGDFRLCGRDALDGGNAQRPTWPDGVANGSNRSIPAVQLRSAEGPELQKRAFVVRGDLPQSPRVRRARPSNLPGHRFRTLRGAAGTAGEFGHIQVAKHDRLCSCRQRGCLEASVNLAAVARAYNGADDLKEVRKLHAALQRPTRRP